MDSITHCILAIDSGGTKCDALLTRDDGALLGWSRVNWDDPESGRSSHGSGRSRASVVRAIRQVMQGATCDELHISAVAHRAHFMSEACALVTRRIHTYSVNECDPAFALSGSDHGIVVLAGTGGAVYGHAMDGRQAQLDGLGPLLGDYGSGYQIGQLALRAVARAGWHPRHATSLTLAIHQALGITDERYSRDYLVQFMLGERDRAEVAALARLVDREAVAGDAIAIDILREAAAAMAESVFDLAERLDLRGQAFPLIASGSIAMRSTIFWEHLCARVLAFAPAAQPMRPLLPPVVGAALIPLRAIAADTAQAEARLRQAAEEKGMAL